MKAQMLFFFQISVRIEQFCTNLSKHYRRYVKGKEFYYFGKRLSKPDKSIKT